MKKKDRLYVVETDKFKVYKLNVFARKHGYEDQRKFRFHKYDGCLFLLRQNFLGDWVRTGDTFEKDELKAMLALLESDDE